MLAAIFSQVGMTLINAVLGNFLEAFKAYENKTISIEQLKDQLLAAMTGAVKDVEVAHADALAKTYASFMATLEKSKMMQRVWCAVTLSQLGVLLWSQVGVSALVFITGQHWPSAGTTADWAYLLLGGMMGLGPIVLKSGPGSATIADKLKTMIGK